jgi:universal stress protein A
MEDINRILVLSRYTKECKKAVQYGISLARHYGADLYVLHVVHPLYLIEGWIFPKFIEEGYKKLQQEAKEDLDRLIEQEKKNGMPITVFIREGDPTEEVLKVIEEQKIDLLIMTSHKAGRLEHFFLFRGTEDLMRKMPCSIMLVKQEPGPPVYYEYEGTNS